MQQRDLQVRQKAPSDSTMEYISGTDSGDTPDNFVNP